MITGFNTDIEHDGVVYHVQTEDKGLESPIILSLVYVGGTILAAKRSPYKDLIASGFSDEELAERLKRQHRLICAAIHSGRVNDLKKMSPRSADAQEVEVIAPPATDEPLTFEFETFSAAYLPGEASSRAQEAELSVDTPVEKEEVEGEAEQEAANRDEAAPKLPAYTIHDPRRQMPPVEASWTEEGLVITLLDDEQFYAGETRTLSVLVTNRSSQVEKPLGSVAVSIKILGTTFRPMIYSLKTQRDGLATVSAQIPSFTSGRAAVLIRVVAKGQAAELRRVIHPGR